ncbi:MAG: NirA family protein, partial [Planctomycetia bacterium]
LQIREIPAEHGPELLLALQEAGLVARGSGADNIRNIVGSPVAGVDYQELIDTQPLCRELHHYILNHREMYGLPRKFNVAFDGGGRIGVLEETNDIGFSAVRVVAGRSADGAPIAPGVYFRMGFGGITGHKDFARDCGVLLKPAECLPAAVAAIEAFIEHGDRTDRKKARLKYVLDRMGHVGFLKETERYYGKPFRKLPAAECEPRGPIDRMGHVGFHPQATEGRSYVGVVLPVGRMTVAQMRGLADLADRRGSGSICLTVWQNLLITDLKTEEWAAVEDELQALGLTASAGPLRAGLIACTGSRGCKFAATDTKGHALALADALDDKLPLDLPLNVHFTGCHHSCAQHYVGDVGLLGAKVEVGDQEVEGYKIFIGGGTGTDPKIGRLLEADVPFDEVPGRIEGLLRFYLEERADENETFRDFAARRPIEELEAAVR